MSIISGLRYCPKQFCHITCFLLRICIIRCLATMHKDLEILGYWHNLLIFVVISTKTETLAWHFFQAGFDQRSPTMRTKIEGSFVSVVSKSTKLLGF